MIQFLGSQRLQTTWDGSIFSKWRSPGFTLSSASRYIRWTNAPPVVSSFRTRNRFLSNPESFPFEPGTVSWTARTVLSIDGGPCLDRSFCGPSNRDRRNGRAATWRPIAARRRHRRAMDATRARIARSWTPARCLRRTRRPKARPATRWSASGGDRTPETASEGMRKTLADLNAILGEEEEEAERNAETNQMERGEVRRTKRNETRTCMGATGG